MSRSKKSVPDWLTAAPIAHRGLHCLQDSIPENSLAAFEAGARRGIAVEMDVHLSSDGQVIVFHDAELARMTGAAGRVADLTAGELQALPLAGTRETIPLLRDVMEQIDGRVPLLIEIKNFSPVVGVLEQATLDTLAPYGGDYALQSFNPFALRYIRRVAPQIVRGQLAERSDGLKAPRLLRYALRNLLFNAFSRPDFIGYDIDALPQPAVTRARRAGLPLLAWTIRTEAQRVRARAIADNYIFEDIAPHSP